MDCNFEQRESKNLLKEVKFLNKMATDVTKYYNDRALRGGKDRPRSRERGEWSVWSEIKNRTGGMIERNE